MLDEHETRLVERCRNGNEAAWAELYQTHAPTVTRFIARMLLPKDVVEDLVQQVFVEVFSSLKRFRGDSKVSTWLYRVAVFQIQRHLRSEWRLWRRKRAAADVCTVLGIFSSDNPAMHAEMVAQLRVLKSTLDSMNSKHRFVWVMRELQGLSTEEVAAVLDTKVGTVRSRLFEARRQVFAAFGKAGFATDGLSFPLGGIHFDEIAAKTRGASQ